MFIFSQAATLSLSLSFIHCFAWNKPPETFELFELPNLYLRGEPVFPFKKRKLALCVLNRLPLVTLNQDSEPTQVMQVSLRGCIVVSLGVSLHLPHKLSSCLHKVNITQHLRHHSCDLSGNVSSSSLYTWRAVLWQGVGDFSFIVAYPRQLQ